MTHILVGFERRCIYVKLIGIFSFYIIGMFCALSDFLHHIPFPLFAFIWQFMNFINQYYCGIWFQTVAISMSEWMLLINVKHEGTLTSYWLDR